MTLLETLRCEDSSDMRQQEREARIVLAKLLKAAAQESIAMIQGMWTRR